MKYPTHEIAVCISQEMIDVWKKSIH